MLVPHFFSHPSLPPQGRKITHNNSHTHPVPPLTQHSSEYFETFAESTAYIQEVGAAIISILQETGA